MGVVALAAFCAGVPLLWYAFARLGALGILGLVDSRRWQDELFNNLRGALLVLSFVVPMLVTAYSDYVVFDLLGGGTAGRVGALLVDGTLATAVITVATVAQSRGQRPFTDARRGEGFAVPAAFRRRWWVGVVVPAALFSYPWTAAVWQPVPIEPYWIVPFYLLAYGVKGTVAIPIGPARNPAWASVREPTDEERATLRRCLDRDLGWVQVFAGDTNLGLVTGAGSGALASTWIDETAFDELTETELAVGLTLVDELRRRHYVRRHLLVFVAILVGLLTALFWLVLFDVPLLLPVGAATFSVAVLLLAGRRLQRRVHSADEAVVAAFDAETVRSVYETVGEEFGPNARFADLVSSLSVLGLDNWIRPVPPLSERLSQLEGQPAADPADD